jgi:hypothetical protein
MPERLDRVLIATMWGDRPDTKEISWASRDQLLEEIRHLAAGPAIVEKFTAVGASRPVELNADEKALLVDAIELMGRNAGALDKIPDDLVELRHALVDEQTR